MNYWLSPPWLKLNVDIVNHVHVSMEDCHFLCHLSVHNVTYMCFNKINNTFHIGL